MHSDGYDTAVDERDLDREQFAFEFHLLDIRWIDDRRATRATIDNMVRELEQSRLIQADERSARG